MKILIMGTSNSLIKGGWVEGFTASLPTAEIVNISLGASPGIQFSSVLEEDFSAYSYVIFDSVPNDEEYQYRNAGYSDIAFTTNILYDICSTIASQTRLVVLGISTKQNFYKESEVYFNRRRIAQACGSQFIDIRSLLHTNSNLLMLMSHASDLYDVHPAHPFPPIMRIIGGALARSLKNYPTALNGSKPISRKDRYITIDVAKRNDVRTIAKANRLLSETFAELYLGESIVFGASNRCVGFYLNHAATNTELMVEGNNKNYKINLSNNRTSDRLLKVFVALPNGVYTHKINVTTPPSSVSRSYNPVIFSDFTKNSNVKLQISKIVFLNDSVGDLSLDDSFVSKDHDALTRAIQDELDNLSLEFWDNHRKTGITASFLKNSFGQFIFYNIDLNKCVAVDSKYVSASSGQLFQVVIHEHGNECKFYACINNSLILLSFFTQGISIHSSNLIPVSPPKGDFLGSTTHLKINKDGSFSIRCLDNYVFSAPNHEVICNRKEARRCEFFSFENSVNRDHK